MHAVNELIMLYNKLDSDDFYKNAIYQILKNLEYVPKLSTYELAERCYVSSTTIRRISSRLGYDSYNDFKMSVGMDLKEVHANILFSYSEMEWSSEFVEKGIDYAIDTLMEVKKTISDEIIIKAAKCLDKAKHVALFMAIDSSLLRNLQMRLLLKGKDVCIAKTPTERRECARHILPQSVIVFVEMVSRISDEDIKTYHIAKEKGVTYIHITDKTEAQLVNDSDIYLGYNGSTFRRDFYGTETILACLCIAFSNLSKG